MSTNRAKDKIKQDVLLKEIEKKDIRIKQLETMFCAKNINILTLDVESFQVFLKIKATKKYNPNVERSKIYHWLDIIYQNYATRLNGQYPSLTEREKDICYLSALDFTINDIAQLLNVQSRSVERYISKICEKIGFSKGNQKEFITYVRDFCHKQAHYLGKPLK